MIRASTDGLLEGRDLRPRSSSDERSTWRTCRWHRGAAHHTAHCRSGLATAPGARGAHAVVSPAFGAAARARKNHRRVGAPSSPVFSRVAGVRRRRRGETLEGRSARARKGGARACRRERVGCGGAGRGAARVGAESRRRGRRAVQTIARRPHRKRCEPRHFRRAAAAGT